RDVMLARHGKRLLPLPGRPITAPCLMELCRMNRLLPFAFAALALAAAAPVAAQSLDALTAAEQQVAAAWEATPLTFRKTLFANRIEAFGVYEAKEGSSFRPGEPIVVYAEPVGYGYKTNAD